MQQEGYPAPHQESPGAALRQEDQGLEVGVGVVQPSAQAAVEQEGAAAPLQPRPDRQQHVGVVLFRRVAQDVLPLRDAPQGVEIPDNQVRREPLVPQMAQARVGGDHQGRTPGTQDDPSRGTGSGNIADRVHRRLSPPEKILRKAKNSAYIYRKIVVK